MPRYFFDLHDDDRHWRDGEVQSFPTGHLLGERRFRRSRRLRATSFQEAAAVKR